MFAQWLLGRNRQSIGIAVAVRIRRDDRRLFVKARLRADVTKSRPHLCRCNVAWIDQPLTQGDTGIGLSRSNVRGMPSDSAREIHILAEQIVRSGSPAESQLTVLRWQADVWRARPYDRNCPHWAGCGHPGTWQKIDSANYEMVGPSK